MRPCKRVHGVFREAGDRPNVVLAHCVAEYYARHDTRAAAQRLWQRVLNCFEGAALATGCKMCTPSHSTNYADVCPSAVLCRAYVEAMPAGSVSYDTPADFLAGSTDMGDVTYECPGFHGAFGIETEGGQGNHTLGFAKAAGTDESYRRAVECGKGMAFVGEEF